MEFGKTLDPFELAKIQFSLPALESVEEAAQLARVAKAAGRSTLAPEIYIGIPIFSHAGWAGNFYPEGIEASGYLKAYAAQLKTVELNSTFYAIPPVENFLKWKGSVGPEFKFCPKFPKSISHSLDLEHPDLKIFLDRVSLLGENLGVCFLQLPHYFSARDTGRVLALLSALPKSLRTVVELRNADFFAAQRLKPEWVENLATRFLGAVTIDAPLERPIAHVSLTSTRTMIRFLGANLHDTDFSRLQEWAKRIALWHVSGLKEIYFLIHEADNGAAPYAAKKMIEYTNAELKALGSTYQIPNVEWHSMFDYAPDAMGKSP
jgi:uncharacterized protein YecE (DUF72 family)